MTVLQRYFISSITKAVLFVLVAFLALFAFFDLIGELSAVGRGGYRLQHAFLYIFIGMPGYIYELMPIAVLIGTIYALALFASNSEFTIMRVSSMSTFMAGKMLIKIGIGFLLFTFLIGEVITPLTARIGTEFKMNLLGVDISGKMRSGLWGKDVLRANAQTGEIIGSRFINAKSMKAEGTIERVKFYEFDNNLRLAKIVTATSGDYLGNKTWRLHDVTESVLKYPVDGKNLEFPASAPVLDIRKMASITLASEVTPEIWSVVAADPNKMSAYDLAIYNNHLVENKQDATVYQIAFWKKLIYPFTVFVMMAVALPFAYLHFRSGGVSLKIFTGIMIGVSFVLINNLFAHIGLLNTWPPLMTALLPSILFLSCAMVALWWVERH